MEFLRFHWVALVALGSCGGTAQPAAPPPAPAPSEPPATVAPVPTSPELVPVPPGETEAEAGAAATSCGSERWPVKIGADNDAANVNMTAELTKIKKLRVVQPPGPIGSNLPRQDAVESQLYELRNVRLVCFVTEGDHDFHIVLEEPSDPGVPQNSDPNCKLISSKSSPATAKKANTIIVEIPDPKCMAGALATWRSAVTSARTEFAAEHDPTGTPKRVNETVSFRGVGFFDKKHGQIGLAPNGIELHPVTALCFGRDCQLP